MCLICSNPLTNKLTPLYVMSRRSPFDMMNTSHYLVGGPTGKQGRIHRRLCSIGSSLSSTPTRIPQRPWPWQLGSSMGALAEEYKWKDRGSGRTNWGMGNELLGFAKAHKATRPTFTPHDPIPHSTKPIDLIEAIEKEESSRAHLRE